jgi:hypothetical protein
MAALLLIAIVVGVGCLVVAAYNRLAAGGRTVGLPRVVKAPVASDPASDEKGPWGGRSNAPPGPWS